MKTPTEPTLKIHTNLDFSSDLIHFLAQVRRARAKWGELKPFQLKTFLHPWLRVTRLRDWGDVPYSTTFDAHALAKLNWPGRTSHIVRILTSRR